jgi:hypothetical protein
VGSSYRTYNEWQKLTPEQWAAILEAREKEKEKTEPMDEHDPKGERLISTGNSESSNKRKQQRVHKFTRRQAISHNNDHHDNEEEDQREEDPL